MPVAFNTGYDSVVSNVGNLMNQGFEVTLGAVPFAGKFSWNMDFTLGYNKNEITNLAGSQENLRGNSILGITYWTEITEGQPIGTIYGYKTDGIVQLGEDLSGIPFFAGKTLRHGDRKYVNKMMTMLLMRTICSFWEMPIRTLLLALTIHSILN